VLPSTLIPGVKHSDLEKAQEREEIQRNNQTANFNQRHKAKPLPLLRAGDEVWIRDMDRQATVVRSDHDRSYTVETESGLVRRNRAALVEMPSQKPQSPTSLEQQPQPELPKTPTRAPQETQKQPCVSQSSKPASPEPSSSTLTVPEGQVRTSYGRVVVKPKRYGDIDCK
jgi:hypothetical protein